MIQHIEKVEQENHAKNQWKNHDFLANLWANVMVRRPSVRLSVRLSVCPSVRLSVNFSFPDPDLRHEWMDLIDIGHSYELW